MPATKTISNAKEHADTLVVGSISDRVILVSLSIKVLRPLEIIAGSINP